MHDRRARASLLLGMMGLILGVASVFSYRPLAVLAGLAALGAGALTPRPARRDPGPAPAPPRHADVTPTDPEFGLIDPLTGLYSESYLLVTLDARLAAARRRLSPLSVVMVRVTIDPAGHTTASDTPDPVDPLFISDVIHATVREADTASRFANGRYVLLLEDTVEAGAIWTVERLRSALAARRPGTTVRAGIACYPAHAFSLEELLQQAGAALQLACEWRQDRIEIATGI